MAIVRTLNENHAGEKFTAYQDGRDNGVHACRLFDAYTLHVPGGDAANDLMEALYDAEDVSPAAVDEVLSKLEGEWQHPAKSQCLPSRELGLLVFHA